MLLPLRFLEISSVNTHILRTPATTGIILWSGVSFAYLAPGKYSAKTSSPCFSAQWYGSKPCRTCTRHGYKPAKNKDSVATKCSGQMRPRELLVYSQGKPSIPGPALSNMLGASRYSQPVHKYLSTVKPAYSRIITGAFLFRLADGHAAKLNSRFYSA